MNLKKENRSGSKWRRSLMALAILSAPVISVAGFSGAASASTFVTGKTAVETCDGNNKGLTVSIAKDANNDKFSIAVEGSVTLTELNGGPSNNPANFFFPKADGSYTVTITRTTGASGSWTGPVVVDCVRPFGPNHTAIESCGASNGINVFIQATNNENYEVLINGTKVSGTPDLSPSSSTGNTYFYLIVDGTHPVQINQTTGSPKLSYEGSVTVGCVAAQEEEEDRAATDTFEVERICTGEKGILVTLTSNYNNKSPYVLSVSKDLGTPSVIAFDEIGDFVQVSSSPPVYSASETFLNGEGSYNVSILHQNSNKVVKYRGTDQSATLNVVCPLITTTSPGYNFTFNLPKVTTAPVLPSTGSESNNLLVIAPVMMLLGAGLILARRRTSTV